MPVSAVAHRATEAVPESATIAVCQEPLDLLELQESPESLESLEPPECQGTPESLLSKPASQSPHHHASHAPLDHQDHQAPTELQVTPDRTEIQEPQETTEPQETQDPKDHQEAQETQEPQEPPASQDKMPNPMEFSPESQDLPDHQDPPELQETPVPPETMVPPDSQARRDPMDNLDNLDRTEIPEPQDSQEAQEMLERRVSAPSTAPSTEECSSRTEPDDKQFARSTSTQPFESQGIKLILFLLLPFSFMHKNNVSTYKLTFLE